MLVKLNRLVLQKERAKQLKRAKKDREAMRRFTLPRSRTARLQTGIAATAISLVIAIILWVFR